MPWSPQQLASRAAIADAIAANDANKAKANALAWAALSPLEQWNQR